jgi:hypothetical protein
MGRGRFVLPRRGCLGGGVSRRVGVREVLGLEVGVLMDRLEEGETVPVFHPMVEP